MRKIVCPTNQPFPPFLVSRNSHRSLSSNSSFPESLKLLSMGLPAPNTTRFPTSQRASQILALLPLPVQNQIRMRGAKAIRITVFGTKSR
jgi:hypothetical protein